MDAATRGIYVSIMLFEGNAPASVPAAVVGSPFSANNNVNGIHVDQNGDGKATEAYSLEIPGITAIQDAYVRKVIDTVNDLDNVLYEICNECPANSTRWQYRLIDLIKNYEAGKPKQHPVGMTIQIGGSVDALYRSSADWISPHSEPSHDYLADPKPGDGTKVIILDSDHITYFAAYAGMIWRQFTRGLNPVFMDLAPPLRDKTPLPEQDSIRKAMGYTYMLAKKMNLAAMAPRGELTSTGYALANPGSEYLVYAPSGGSFTVNLAAGSYFFDWVNPSNGTTLSGGSFSAASGDKSFTPPFSGDAVLSIKAQAGLHRLVP
jgi:hypothetical protein